MIFVTTTIYKNVIYDSTPLNCVNGEPVCPFKQLYEIGPRSENTRWGLVSFWVAAGQHLVCGGLRLGIRVDGSEVQYNDLAYPLYLTGSFVPATNSLHLVCPTIFWCYYIYLHFSTHFQYTFSILILLFYIIFY